ncbi:MAG: VOC family protein [Myxococcales bacterium]|nr:VOC family protein [Myxococcales bacterium]
MAVQRFSHIAIRVTDLERSRRFYRDALEFRELTELEITGGPTALLLDRPDLLLRAIFMERDGTQVELQQLDLPGRVEAVAWTRVGLAHIALRVDDLETTLERVERAGGGVLEASRFRSEERGSEVVFITDPDGTYVEIIRAPGDPAVPPGESLRDAST